MITTLEDAQAEVLAMRADAEADNPEIELDHADLVVGVMFSIADDDLARELCRVELGHVPLELEARLGKKDWLES
jgi:hypothetical protein